MALKINNSFIFKSFIILFIVIIGIGMYYINKDAIQKELISLKLVPLPERFTELYFNNHTDLPTKVITNNPILFSFVIHNLEDKNFNYTYSVYLNNNGAKTLIDKSTVMLKNNEYKTISENFVPTEISSRQQVVVDLVNIKQSIDFWIQ